MTSSFPLPPSTVSLPWPGFQTKKSLPFPRNTESLPLPASTLSSPFPPETESMPSPVLMLSLPFPPSIVNALSTSTPDCSVNWSSPLPSDTEMAVKSARVKRCTSAGSFPNATWTSVASAPRATTSGPLVPATMSVLLAMNAEPAFCAAAADAVSAGPAYTRPRSAWPRPRSNRGLACDASRSGTHRRGIDACVGGHVASPSTEASGVLAVAAECACSRPRPVSGPARSRSLNRSPRTLTSDARDLTGLR